jgi:RNA ligase (TIGR02306 family)
MMPKHPLYNDECLRYEPKMAVVMYIDGEKEIDGADNIKQVVVTDGSSSFIGVVKKSEFSYGDKCIVFMHDAVLPCNETFDFMKSRKYRVAQCRFMGAPSEVLIIPIGDLGIDGSREGVGADFTTRIGVLKYEKPIPVEVAGMAKGNFPSHLFPKTDEILFQKCQDFIDRLVGLPYYITEKVDGTSQTVYINNGTIGACSRNLELKLNGTGAIDFLMKKYSIENALKNSKNSSLGNFAIQWECYGPNICKNPLGVSEIDMAIFNLYDIDYKCYCSYHTLEEFCRLNNLPMVRVIEEGDHFEYYDHDQLLKLAEGKYPNGHEREGIVIRPKFEESVMGQRLSFKVINLKYKG